MAWELLSEAEKTAAEGKGLEVVVVDPRGRVYEMKLTKWKSMNVLNSAGWRKFVEDNGLKAKVYCAQVWTFRSASAKLCFAFDVKRQPSV